MQPKTEQIIKL